MKKFEANKEDTEAAVKAEQSRADSYAVHLKQLDETPDIVALSNALQEVHVLNQDMILLKQQNTELEKIKEGKNQEKKVIIL